MLRIFRTRLFPKRHFYPCRTLSNVRPLVLTRLLWVILLIGSYHLLLFTLQGAPYLVDRFIDFSRRTVSRLILLEHTANLVLICMVPVITFIKRHLQPSLVPS